VEWLLEPEMPFMVTVKVPRATERLTLTVSVLVVVAGLGLKEAEAPLGRPEADSVALPEKPLRRVMETVLVALLPRATFRVLGDEERLKSGCGAALTVSETVVVRVRLPDAPEIVTVKFPVAAVADAERVSALVVAVGLGLKDAVTPLGKPEAERVTLPANPFAGVIVTVLPPAVP